jgi:hypothetical protein
MFAFEGALYALLASALGSVAGVGVGSWSKEGSRSGCSAPWASSGDRCGSLSL